MIWNWRRNDSKQNPTPPSPSPAMERLPANSRAVCAYRGRLVPGHLHTLRIEHLRPIPGEKYKPFKLDDGKTHHLWILYCSLSGGPPTVLVSQQFSFASFCDDRNATLDLWQLPDRAAARIGKSLATSIAPGIMTELKDPKLLRRIPDRALEEEFAPVRDLFWAEAVSKLVIDMRQNPQAWNL